MIISVHLLLPHVLFYIVQCCLVTVLSQIIACSISLCSFALLYAPRGVGVPPFPPFFLVHLLPYFLLYFTFSLFFSYLLYLLFFICPSLSVLPE